MLILDILMQNLIVQLISIVDHMTGQYIWCGSIIARLNICTVTSSSSSLQRKKKVFLTTWFVKKQSERSSSPQILLTDLRLFIRPFDLRDYQNPRISPFGPVGHSGEEQSQWIKAFVLIKENFSQKKNQKKKSVTLSEMAS